MKKQRVTTQQKEDDKDRGGGKQQDGVSDLYIIDLLFVDFTKSILSFSLSHLFFLSLSLSLDSFSWG